ncbi:MAG: DNA primase [Lutibacter sp.]|mgnify:CR=1 FL=1|nr:DNA primase [Lutibacter sp.]MBP9599881.1 DNA primase [Lutibacter sp.]
MKRIIVDYKKLTPEILNLLVEKFPDGYGIRDIVRFTNPKGHYVEAVEVRTDDTIYLVKISDELVDTMDKYEEDEDEDIIISDDLDLDVVKGGIGVDDLPSDDDDVDDYKDDVDSDEDDEDEDED